VLIPTRNCKPKYGVYVPISGRKVDILQV
jgi:hypothetical protein